MTIATRPNVLANNSEAVVVEGVSWETYERLLEDIEISGQNLRITYDQGRMHIMSPLPKHEKWKSLFGCLVEGIAYEKNIPIRTFGSTTWKRKSRRRGLESDECFYIQNESKVRAKLDFDMERDPAPDLAIEVDLRRSSIDRLSVYAALGVGEVWSFDGDTIEVYVLQAGGEYKLVEFSAALPFLRPADLKRFLDMFGTTDQNSIVRAVREWAKTLG